MDPVYLDPNLFGVPPADAIPREPSHSKESSMQSLTQNGVTVYFYHPNGLYEFAECDGERYAPGDHEYCVLVYRFIGKDWNGTAW